MRVGCFAHARRYYTDALKILPKEAAIVYSIVETAKMNGLNPFYYLKYIFEELPNTKPASPEALDYLLPWSTTLPEECRTAFKSRK